MIKKNGGIFGRNPTYNDVVVEGVLTLKEAQVFDNDITINGDLTVNGTTTTINTVNLDVDDKNITLGAAIAKVGLVSASNITIGQFTVLIADTAGLVPGMTVTKTAGTGAFAAGAKIASVDSHYQITLDLAHTASGSITFDTGGATDFTADGGGITLKGLTDKFIKWIKSTGAWTFSDKIEVPDVTVTNMTASLAVFTDSNKKLVTQSQQNALNAIAGAVTSGQYLRGNGTNVGMSAIQAADVPTLNQSTTGSALSVKSNATTGVHQIVGPAAGTTRVMTVPDANFTAARTDAAQTFTGAQTFGNLKLDTNTLSSTTGGISLSPASGVVSLGGNKLYMDASGVRSWQQFVNQTSGTFYVESGAATDGIWTVNGFQIKEAGGVLVGSGSFGGNGYLTVQNNVIIGTSGRGIDFSATSQAGGMTSELLADYEEGTFTPTLGGTTTNPTVTYSIQRGRYTKIGRLVTVECYVAWSAFSGGSGNVNVGGLPFTIDPNTGASGGGAVSYFDGFTLTASRTSVGLLANANTTTATPMCMGSGVSTQYIGVGSVAASGLIIFTMSYSV